MPREGDRGHGRISPMRSGGYLRDASVVTQIVGKIRLSQTPWLNHSWQVALYVTARGLTTSPIPSANEFSDRLRFHRPFASYRGERRNAAAITPPAQPIADFYAAVMAALDDLGIRVKIGEWPNEVPNLFASATTECMTLRARIRAPFWRVLLQLIACSSSSALASLASAAPCILLG